MNPTNTQDKLLSDSDQCIVDQTGTCQHVTWGEVEHSMRVNGKEGKVTQRLVRIPPGTHCIYGTSVSNNETRITYTGDSGLAAQVDDLVDWLVETDEARPATDEEISEFKRRLMALIKSDREARDLSVRIEERKHTWQLINDIRYQNISLDFARSVSLERLSALEAEQEVAQLSKGEKQ